MLAVEIGPHSFHTAWVSRMLLGEKDERDPVFLPPGPRGRAAAGDLLAGDVHEAKPWS